MNFETPLLEGTLVSREKKFVAEVTLPNGTTVSAHIPNRGALRTCMEPGNKVLISKHNNPRSRYKHHIEIVFEGDTKVAVHSGRVALILAEALLEAKIPELAGYATLSRAATKHGKETRIELVAEGNGLRPCFLKVVNVVVAESGVASYPDTVVDTGVQSLQDMTNLIREGNRAMVVFLVQRDDATSFHLAGQADANLLQAYIDAQARGLETICYRTRVTENSIEIDTSLPVVVGDN